MLEIETKCSFKIVFFLSLSLLFSQILRAKINDSTKIFVFAYITTFGRLLSIFTSIAIDHNIFLVSFFFWLKLKSICLLNLAVVVELCTQKKLIWIHLQLMGLIFWAHISDPQCDWWCWCLVVDWLFGVNHSTPKKSCFLCNLVKR